ncbi:MAG TPA: S8 family serine peptidase [Blastocatellia bacterium]|nr:S8 family serine peptidase [Blastocatellia bacterium]
MSRIKASLMFDPNRRKDQLDFVRQRVTDLYEYGNQVWASITEEQAARFAEQGIYVQFHEEADLIRLPAVIFDPAEAVPEPPAELTAKEPSGEETAYYLVQFIAPTDPSWINFIEELGASYVEDAHNQTCVFLMTAEQAAQAAQARETAHVKWVGLYHPAYALSYRLAGRDEPFAAGDLHELKVAEERFTPNPSGTTRVLFFMDLATEEMIPAIEATGATVVSDTGYSLILDMSAEQVMPVLRVPGVSALEPYKEPRLHNQRAGIILGADQVRDKAFLVHLDGEEEIVGIIDTGLDKGNTADMHPDLAGRVLLLTKLNPTATTMADLNPHGTHVAGSIAGNAVSAPPPSAANPQRSIPRGVAPACKIVFHSVNEAGPAPAKPPHTPAIPCCRRERARAVRLSFSKFINGFQEAYKAGARVHNNSWGGESDENTYSKDSNVIDRFAFLHPDTLIIFAAGNEEGDARFDVASAKWVSNGKLDQDRVGEEALAKNVLAIGACENETTWDGDVRNYRDLLQTCVGHKDFDAAAGGVGAASAAVEGKRPISDSADHIAMFSSRGRVKRSNRVKPDLVAPGTNILSTRPRDLPDFPPMVAPRCSAPGAALTVANPRIPRTAPDKLYYVSSGTSMAAPLASGAAALVRQYYRGRLSQLRRPLLIEALATAAPPLAFVDLPAAASHQKGCVLAWVRPTAAAGPNHVVAARFTHQPMQVENVVQLQANVGAHPAISLARHNDNTLLAHRTNNDIRLSLYNDKLDPVVGFGTKGVVNVANNSATGDDRRPAICVRDNEVAVVWAQNANDALLFQRHNAADGTMLGTAAVNIGAATNTSTHPYLVHNGSRYAAVWVRLSGGNHQLLMRFIDNTGNALPAQPITLHSQSQPIREAHLVWDTRQSCYLVVWVGEDAAGNHVFALRVRPDGTPVGAPEALLNAKGSEVVRRPRIHLHADSGYVLIWEDNKEGSHDLYLTFLNDAARLDGRINKDRLQISDTPNDISGFSALVDGDGILPVWQSNDEINSDSLGVYALNVTKGGAFQSQVDPNTPLLQNGHYVPHVLLEHTDKTLNEVAMAWGGGVYFHLRAEPTGGIPVNLSLVRTNADGKPETTFNLHSSLGFSAVSLYWDNTRLIAACNELLNARVFICDSEGKNTLGAGGSVLLAGATVSTISVQLARAGAGAASRIFVAFGNSNGAGPHRIRYTVMTETGARTGAGTVAERDLVAQVSGTAKQGWFHLLSSDTPAHLIAAWHVTVGGNMVVQLNRFQPNGNPQSGVAGPIKLTALPGDSKNAVIAPRPVLFDPPFPTPKAFLTKSRQREYGVAWQYQPSSSDPWQIRFSRLNRDGTVLKTAPDPDDKTKTLPTADVSVFADAAYHGTDPQLVWHTDGYGIAWLREPKVGGNHQLFFTALDQFGRRVNLALPGAAAAPVPEIPISSAGADAQDFHLVWNGRVFRITWTEVSGNNLRHMQSAIAVPRLQGETRYDEPFRQPSAALVRATLINGATNIRKTELPNSGNDPNDGYGWGRINLRQSLSPVGPVTFHARDDGAVGSGLKASYQFELPPNTRLLRITLAWTDPPGNHLVNRLNLVVTSKVSGAVYVGNRWQTGPETANSGPQFSLPLPNGAAPVDFFQKIHNAEQIVIADPTVGLYLVDVVSQPFSDNAFMQFPGQPFALVFVGSGQEIRITIPSVAPGTPPRIY